MCRGAERARSELELKFTLGLCSEQKMLAPSFTQKMQMISKCLLKCDEKQKRFTQKVKTLNRTHQLQNIAKKLTQVV
jgi:hypothetical protein